MKTELRIVVSHLANQPLVVRDRSVQLDDEGLTEPLTAAEHTYLASIPGFECAARLLGEECPLCEPEIAGETLVAAVVEAFEGEVIDGAEWGERGQFCEPIEPTGPDADSGEEEEEEQEVLADLPEAWLEMDATARAETVRDLEDFGAQEAVFLYLFDYEAKHGNNPTVLAAVDTALGHLRPARSTEQINAALFRQSAAGKVKTKNPPSPKRGK